MKVKNKTDNFDWDKSFMDMIKIFEKGSKCAAKKVVCVLVKNNNILSIGINGTLPKKLNCEDFFIKENGKWKYWEKDENGNNRLVIDENGNKHKKWSEINEIHAEINAIKKATQDGNFNIEDATAYISYSPCLNCSKTLALYGIKRVVFRELFDDSEEVISFLIDNDIEVVRYIDDDNVVIYCKK